MTQLDEIKTAATKLSLDEREKLRAFLDELDAAVFDARIAQDAASGKLDALAEEALAEHRVSQTRRLR